MSDIAIKVENLSKLYQLGQIGTGTISRDLERWWAQVRGKEDPFSKIGQVNDRTKKSESDFVWALKDINFEVKKGDVLGIIGRNGAGKSTLLKVLSKITAPSSGKIYVDGRIASLLEVGTGFHPEMTGRENIFMNGALLGMRKWEIKKKFDEIVDFAGVEAYIDTPVKRYSSGMYVRLAFAVAAFLEPEILIVDEVLAVGDAEFQKKCLGRMKDVSVNDGRTVLFVSHQLGSIKQLCDSAIMLINGKLVESGKSSTVVAKYLENINQNANNLFKYIYGEDTTSKKYYIKSFAISTLTNDFLTIFGSGSGFQISIEIYCKELIESVEFALALFDRYGNRVFTIHEPLFDKNYAKYKSEQIFQIKIPGNFLTPGKYFFTCAVHIPHIEAFHVVENIAEVTIVDDGSVLADYEGHDIGVVFPKYELHRIN